MHLEETYTGIMRIASNRAGKPYKDWREHYIDQAGLIMIFQSDSRPDKYAVYFFMPRGMYMKRRTVFMSLILIRHAYLKKFFRH